MKESILSNEVKDKLIDEIYDEIANDAEKDIREICYEALKAYTKFRVLVTLMSSEKAYNDVHEITMDTSVDVSDAIIESYRKAHGK